MWILVEYDCVFLYSIILVLAFWNNVILLQKVFAIIIITFMFYRTHQAKLWTNNVRSKTLLNLAIFYFIKIQKSDARIIESWIFHPEPIVARSGVWWCIQPEWIIRTKKKRNCVSTDTISIAWYENVIPILLFLKSFVQHFIMIIFIAIFHQINLLRSPFPE